MSKQDGYSSRTAADLERRYNFGKTFAEVYNLISDAKRAAQEAQKAYDDLTQDEIFNLLTDFGKSQGVYRGDDDNVYINASFVKSGTIKAGLVEVEAAAIKGTLTAQNVSVEAAAITGSLTVGGGVLPDNLAVKTDIPTNISAFTNDSNYVPVSNMTTIVEGIVTTDYIYARGVSATYLKGETIDLRDAAGNTLGQFDIYTDSYNNACVRLSATEIIELIAPEEIYLEAGGYYFFLNEDGLSLNCDMEPSKRACCGTETFPWYEVYVQYDPVVTSDRRKKKNIVYGADSMDSFFDDLKPSKYQILEEDDEHDHWGFVAQDIKENLERHKIPMQSFGGFVERTDKNGETHLGLRYGEFVALLVDQVQKLKGRVAELEGKKHGQKA